MLLVGPHLLGVAVGTGKLFMEEEAVLLSHSWHDWGQQLACLSQSWWEVA